MDNMSTLNTINLLPSTKEEAQSFANDLVRRVNEGEINPLTLKAQMKFIEKTLELVDKQTKDSWIKEAGKYGKSFDYQGWKVEEVEAGTSYDYSLDFEWSELKEKLKERETFLKSLKHPIEVVDKTTGETTTIYPPIKRSTTTLKFTAK
jgi:hypothetical protein